MRFRLAVVLVALLATIAVPAETLRYERAGSAVDQVASCLEANASARDTLGASTAGDPCEAGQGGGAVAPVLAALVVVALLALVRRPPRPLTLVARASDRWRLPDGGWRTTASWRGPPLTA